MEDRYLGLTPPMGWNSWNTFTWNIHDSLIRETADALVETGLRGRRLPVRGGGRLLEPEASGTRRAVWCRTRRNSPRG